MLDNLNEEQKENLIKKISTTLFLYNEPITIARIVEIVEEKGLTQNDFEVILDDINQKINMLGLTLVRTNNKNFEKGEILISVQKDFDFISQSIRKTELEGDLTPASLQVMTICAYLGNPTKNEISFIRGVQSSQSLRSLSARGLIKKEGERCSLSVEAFQKLGISRPEDLPEYEKIKGDFEERLKEILQEQKEDSI